VDPRQRSAAANNADWCDLVCRAHGVPTGRADGWWFSRSPSPTYYPDAVSLVPEAVALPEVVAARAGCAVKDSFATLDLAAYGFAALVDASWITAEPGPGDRQDWQPVRTPEQLERWKAGHGDAPAIHAALLREPDVRVLLSPDGRNGLVASRSAGVVGISNVFGAGAWSAGVAAARYAFPGRPLVGWERDSGLSLALAAGFEQLAPLRVWVRTAADT
jgi:hypothetical protein